MNTPTKTCNESLSAETKASKKYGSVYTPNELADFVAELCWSECCRGNPVTVLDPASGELSLLDAFHKANPNSECNKYIGIDVDAEAIEASRKSQLAKGNLLELRHEDFILPKKSNTSSSRFWETNIGLAEVIISNPPWSSDRKYSSQLLSERGFKLAKGQYDAFLLFIELSLKMLTPSGIAAFIVPDSLFSQTNRELREHLCTNYQIKVIARLGEKIFPAVNRSTAVLLIKNSKPTDQTLTTCFRLDTQARQRVLKKSTTILDEFKKACHQVKQSRFNRPPSYSFDVDTKADDEDLLSKLEKSKIDFNSVFRFSRGVEISKSGLVTRCKFCSKYQGVSPKQKRSGYKQCIFCGHQFATEPLHNLLDKKESDSSVPVLVGEDVKRYRLYPGRFLQLGAPGISYKAADLYDQPKILVRKTGLGINAAIDEKGSYVTQTVYILTLIQPESEQYHLWYYLAILNSRAIFFYYLKVFGENEWKSHPYITKRILSQLPLRNIKTVSLQLVKEIASVAQRLQASYSADIDKRLELLISEALELSETEILTIRQEIGKLPDLSAINEMKY